MSDTTDPMVHAGEAVLIIGGFESSCSNCRRGTDPYAERHDKILGYVNNGEPGCGALFTSVVGVYGNDGPKRMRPDLPIERPRLTGLRE